MYCDFIVNRIATATYVKKGSGHSVHTARPCHGIVLNVSAGDKTYTFSDGRSVTVSHNELLYLPKGSSYRVSSVQMGECYAINFDTGDEQSHPVATLTPKNINAYLTLFEKATQLWRSRSGAYKKQCMAILYEIFALIEGETHKEYLTRATANLIAPAVEYIHQSYTKKQMQISELADMCEISEDYFRKIFRSTYGTTPIRYINALKLRYAKELIFMGECTVGEAAFLAGFTDSSYFSREFTRAYGVCPAHYKAQLEK